MMSTTFTNCFFVNPSFARGLVVGCAIPPSQEEQELTAERDRLEQAMSAVDAKLGPLQEARMAEAMKLAKKG